jgi:uncharacterized Fe-S radical SAM superfamily protein PflX
VKGFLQSLGLDVKAESAAEVLLRCAALCQTCAVAVKAEKGVDRLRNSPESEGPRLGRAEEAGLLGLSA